MGSQISRRTLLRTAVGGGAAAAFAGRSAAQAGEEHTISMTDDLVFDPDAITIAPGDTVVWDNVGSIGHSVTAYEEDIPGEAAYFASGGFDAEQPARNAYTAGDPATGDIAGGETFQHTFEVEGTYEYFCVPHESAGMVGSIDVAAGGAPSNGGETAPTLPEAARTIAVAAVGAMVAVMGLTYFFMKYGGDYGPADED